MSKCLKKAMLFERREKKVLCGTCERRCLIPVSEFGVCKTRKNFDGDLYTLNYGNLSSIMANPIEKKPFFHFFPGTKALTCGSWSCNFECPWCQNWEISKSPPKNCNFVSPERFVGMTEKENCRGTSVSFNEPTLLFEWSLEVFELAKRKNLYNTYVTNGYMTEKALKLLVDAGLHGMNVDVKGDRKTQKKYCGTDVEKVWRNCKIAHKNGIHIEITTLVVPTVNEDFEFFRRVAKRIFHELGEDTPWHLTRFTPCYKFFVSPTSVGSLEMGRRIGIEEGLKYVYVGNVPGHPYENTYCPNCNKLLIQRFVFTVLKNRIKNKKCPRCGERILLVNGKDLN